MFIWRRAARGVAPPKSCAADSNLLLQFIQSNIIYSSNFPIRLYTCMTYPCFVLKSVPKSNFHRLLPAALAQCLLLVVVGGSQDEGSSSSSRCSLIDLCFGANSSLLAPIQTARSVLAASRRLPSPYRELPPW